MNGDLVEHTSVQYLLQQTPTHSGAVKKLEEGLLFSTYSKKFAVLHNGAYYVFDALVSLVPELTLQMSDVSFSECEQKKNKFMFYMQSESLSKTFYFAVDTEKELNDWIKMLSKEKRQNLKLIRTDPDGRSFTSKLLTENNSNIKANNNSDNETGFNKKSKKNSDKHSAFMKDIIEIKLRDRSQTTIDHKIDLKQKEVRRYSGPVALSTPNTTRKKASKLTKFWRSKQNSFQETSHSSKQKMPHNLRLALSLDSIDGNASNKFNRLSSPVTVYPPSPKSANAKFPWDQSPPSTELSATYPVNLATNSHKPLERQESLQVIMPCLPQRPQSQADMTLKPYFNTPLCTSGQVANILKRSDSYPQPSPPRTPSGFRRSQNRPLPSPPRSPNTMKNYPTPVPPNSQPCSTIMSQHKLTEEYKEKIRTKPINLMISRDKSSSSEVEAPRSQNIQQKECEEKNDRLSHLHPTLALLLQKRFSEIKVNDYSLTPVVSNNSNPTNLVSSHTCHKTRTTNGTIKRYPSNTDQPSLDEGKDFVLKRINNSIPKNRPQSEYQELMNGHTENDYITTSQSVDNNNDEYDDYMVAENLDRTLKENEYVPNSVYQWGMDRDGASRLLSNIGADGTYVIRTAKDEKKVLSVFVQQDTKHYKIFQEKGYMFLKRDHPSFQNICDLVSYYRNYDLPTCEARLKEPYRI